MQTDGIFNQLLTIIVPFAVTALSILATWALNELRKFIKAKTGSAELDASITVLDDIVHNVVAKLNETVKVVSADGIITVDEARQLKLEAMASINSQLPASTRRLLEIWIDRLDDFISGKVEVAVLNTKKLKMEAGSAEAVVASSATK
jgi:hypothetical protein